MSKIGCSGLNNLQSFLSLSSSSAGSIYFHSSLYSIFIDSRILHNTFLLCSSFIQHTPISLTPSSSLPQRGVILSLFDQIPISISVLSDVAYYELE